MGIVDVFIDLSANIRVLIYEAGNVIRIAVSTVGDIF